MLKDLPNFHSWETPDLELTISPSGSLAGYVDIIVSIQQGSQSVHLHAADLVIDEDKIFVTLTQEQSGKFDGDRTANVQVNILYDDDIREATTWGEIWVKPNLYRKVMS